VSGLSYEVIYVILRLAVFVQYWRVSDGQTNGQTQKDNTTRWIRHSVAQQSAICAMLQKKAPAFREFQRFRQSSQNCWRIAE